MDNFSELLKDAIAGGDDLESAMREILHHEYGHGGIAPRGRGRQSHPIPFLGSQGFQKHNDARGT